MNLINLRMGDVPAHRRLQSMFGDYIEIRVANTIRHEHAKGA